jgi:hypothetical protein
MPARRKLAVFYPQYGPVRSLLGVGLLYVVVERATRALVATLAAVAPAVPADAIRLAMALSLWLVLALVVLAEGRRQVAGNPRSFIAKEVLVKFLDQHRPTPKWHALALGAALVGGWAMWVGWARFVDSLDGILRIGLFLYRSGNLGSFDPLNLVYGVAFLVGFGLLSWGIDRLAIGGAREALLISYRRRWE